MVEGLVKETTQNELSSLPLSRVLVNYIIEVDEAIHEEMEDFVRQIQAL